MSRTAVMWDPETGEMFDEHDQPVGNSGGPTVGQIAAGGIPLPSPDPGAPVAPAPIVSPTTGAPYQPPPAAPPPVSPADAVAAAGPPPGAAPAPGGAPLPLTKTSDTTTVTRERETAAEKKIVGQQAANEAEARTNLQARQKLDNVLAEETRAAQAADAARRKAALDAHDAEYTRLKGVSATEESKYKQQLADFSNPKNGFYADMTTLDKVGAGISLLLGLVGGLTDGSNVGADRIIKAVDADTAKRRMLLEAQERIVNRAKGDVGDARASLAHQKEMLDLRAAVGLEAAVAQARSRAARLGINEDNLRNNEQLQKLEAEALERRQKHEEGLRSKATTTTVSIAGGAPTRGAAGTETDKKFALMGKGMLDDLVVVGDGAVLTPTMLDQWQRSSTMFDAAGKASESVLGAFGVSVGRGVGLLPRTKYEKLSAPEQAAANALDSAGEKLFRIYTGAGMPVEEARRMVTQQLPHAGDAPTVVQTKIARLKADADRLMALGGRATTTIAGIEREQTGAPPAAAPAAAGRMVRLKDGRTGTLYPDGSFEPAGP